MRAWAKFMVQEVLAHRVCTRITRRVPHYYLWDTYENYYAFERTTEAQTLLGDVSRAFGLSGNVYNTPLGLSISRPPRDMVLRALRDNGADPTPSSVQNQPNDKPLGRSARTKVVLERVVRENLPNMCAETDNCAICTVNRLLNRVPVTPSPVVKIDPSRVGWGLEMETYLPERVLGRGYDDAYDHECDDCNGDDCEDENCTQSSYYRRLSRRTGIIAVGGYHHGASIEAPGAPQGWNAQHDGSLETRRYNYAGVEIVSPILYGKNGLLDVQKMSEFLSEMEPHQNKMSGLHCHVSLPGTDLYKAHHLRHLFAQMELAFYASCGTWATRRMASDYCHPASRWLRDSNMYRERYCTLNMANYNQSYPDESHAEIRIWPGTTDYAKLSMAAHMSVALVGGASELWFPPDNADLHDMGSQIQLMSDLIERYPVASKDDAYEAIDTLHRQAHQCDLDRPAIHTYAITKEEVLP
jgi:hypothetical protein